MGCEYNEPWTHMHCLTNVTLIRGSGKKSTFKHSTVYTFRSSSVHHRYVSFTYLVNACTQAAEVRACIPPVYTCGTSMLACTCITHFVFWAFQFLALPSIGSLFRTGQQRTNWSASLRVRRYSSPPGIHAEELNLLPSLGCVLLAKVTHKALQHLSAATFAVAHPQAASRSVTVANACFRVLLVPSHSCLTRSAGSMLADSLILLLSPVHRCSVISWTSSGTVDLMKVTFNAVD